MNYVYFYKKKDMSNEKNNYMYQLLVLNDLRI